MNTQSGNVKEWKEKALRQGSKGFVDMCDTFDYDHYPIFFGGPDDSYRTGEDVLKAKNGKNMQRSFGIFYVEK